ncbi:MAG: hypothetical protein ACXWJW_07665 [Xanthobacteraceae bacterium]
MFALLLTGCQDYITQFNTPRLDSTVFVPNPTQFARKERALQPVTQADLVDAAGNCAGAAPAVASADGNAVPPAPRGVALEMTECELVQAAGPPASVEVGANQRGDRTVTMTYPAADRPIYHFIDGRLKSIERGAEPPPEPVKKKPPPKRNRQAT